MEERKRIELGPQPGPQTEFLATEADIAIYGGAAGGGKSYALLLDPTRHYHNGKFAGVIFRRNTTQVRNPGGLWDASRNMYPLLQCEPKETTLEWHAPTGWKMKFAHLEAEATVFDWQGAEIPWIGFDELTHFSEFQFFYMLTRNRSTSGVPGAIRATTNPDPDSWVAKFIEWWIDQETGLPIPERAGKLRWFIRTNDEMHWADSKEELEQRFGADCMPKSVTFIPAKLTDNKILMEKDPAYLANLKAQDRVQQARLIDGNWKIKAAAGLYFKGHMFQVVDAIPAAVVQSVRYWDRAATEPNPSNKDPDFTAGLKMSKLADGRFIIEDVARFRHGPHKRNSLIKNVATADGRQVTIGLEQEPGASGKTEVAYLISELAGFTVRAFSPTGDKVTRAGPASSQAEAGNILVLRGAWNKEFFNEAENFPEGGHDDQIDALSGAFTMLSVPKREFNIS